MLIVASLFHLLILASFAYAQVGPSLVGEACTADIDCGFAGDTGVPIGCGVDEICGGKGAQCSYDGNYHGFTETCVSRNCKLIGLCQSDSAVGTGEACDDDTDCLSDTTQCASHGICGGRDAMCTSYDNAGELTSTGFSIDCITRFCRDGRCSNAPITSLGDPCEEDQDCEGTIFGLPVYCNALGRCGGSGATCTADDGTADGYTEACVSGMCVAGLCFGPGPSPGVDTPAKRQIRKQRIFGELCPGNFVPCFVGQGSYECIDIQTDIESCGGCIEGPNAEGSRRSGVDCTSLPHVDSVYCLDGECVIGTYALKE